METRSTVKERLVFTCTALVSKTPFTLQVRLKGPMPWEAQVRLMEEPSTTGSGASGVMNGTGKAGGGEGRGGGHSTWINAIIGHQTSVHTTMSTPLTCFH